MTGKTWGGFPGRPMLPPVGGYKTKWPMKARNPQLARCTRHFSPCGGRRGQLHTAFTLIELLVVIAIISLLVSILLPSLQKARILARSTVCLANLRNIGVGMVIYQQDFHYVPYYFSWAENYVEKNLLLCPEDRDAGLTSSPWASGKRDVPYFGERNSPFSADLNDKTTGVSYWTPFSYTLAWNGNLTAAELYRNDYANEMDRGAYQAWGLAGACPGLSGENFSFVRCYERILHAAEYDNICHHLTPAGNVVLYEPSNGDMWFWPEWYLLPGY